MQESEEKKQLLASKIQHIATRGQPFNRNFFAATGLEQAFVVAVCFVLCNLQAVDLKLNTNVVMQGY